MDGKVYIIGKRGNTLLSDLVADIPEVYIEPIEPKFDFNIDYLKNTEIHATISASNTEIIRLTDLIPETKDQNFTLYVPIVVPNRRHHKKRIQKKWFKRYGYKEYNESIGVIEPDHTEPVDGIPGVFSTTWRFKK